MLGGEKSKEEFVLATDNAICLPSILKLLTERVTYPRTPLYETWTKTQDMEMKALHIFNSRVASKVNREVYL